MRDFDTLSQLTDELNQHLTQVSALIDFMSVDYCNNENEFTAVLKSSEICSGRRRPC